MTNLERATNLELLIELMYLGKSGIVEFLANDEPIDTMAIGEVLASRTGRAPNTDFEIWYAWFVDANSRESDSDKEILRNLREFKSKFDEIVQRIRDSR